MPSTRPILTPEEQAAIDAALQGFYTVNPKGTMSRQFQDFTVPASVFDLVEKAFSHLPMWDSQRQEWYEANCLYTHNGDLSGFMFKGVMMRPEPV